MIETPSGMTQLDAMVFQRDDILSIVGKTIDGHEFSFQLKLVKNTDFGPPPEGFLWTGDIRPPKKGEWFWSEIKGQPVCSVEDDIGFNQFGEPTGGRKILVIKRGPESEHVKSIEAAVKAALPFGRRGMRLVGNDE